SWPSFRSRARRATASSCSGARSSRSSRRRSRSSTTPRRPSPISSSTGPSPAGRRFGSCARTAATASSADRRTGKSSRKLSVRPAFPDEEVELDPHARTVDMLRERSFGDAVFLIGADQFADFLTWKEPNGVLELARLAVATRPGFPRERLDGVLAELDRPDRV